MRTLVLLVAILAASPLIVSSARAASIEKTGVAEVDKLFREVGSIESVLDAADQRMDALIADVSKNLGVAEGASMTYLTYTIKQRANGDIRIINADGRPVLALGAGAPSKAKEAASTLNEGTQELAVMARDIGRLPERLGELATKSGDLEITSTLLSDSGVDAEVSAVEGKVKDNLASLKTTKSRAAVVSNRAADLLDEVREGMSATSEPAGPPVAAAKPTPKPSPTPKPKPNPNPNPKRPSKAVATIGDVVQKAWTYYVDGDIEEAVVLLARADLLLPKQTEIVTRQELIELFQTRALVNLVQGDATAASWAATQALVIHPNCSPVPKLGSDYAKLHKAIAKAGVVRKVDVRVKGDGRAYLSGIEVTGGATIQLGQGLHLLQVERDGAWDSSVVTVREGYTVEF